MYIVFIAGSIPTLSPFFKRYFFKPTKSDYHNRRNTHVNGDDSTSLTLAPVPPGRSKAYASATGRRTPSQIDDDDNNMDWTGYHGHILKTTDINVRRDEEIEGIAR